jgi:hypothetical protein
VAGGRNLIGCLTQSLLSFALRSGVVMARHRRPPVTLWPPPELFVFDAADWDSFESWCAARRDWVKAHPGSPLGSMLDVLKEHRRLRYGQLGWKY